MKAEDIGTDNGRLVGRCERSRQRVKTMGAFMEGKDSWGCTGSHKSLWISHLLYSIRGSD